MRNGSGDEYSITFTDDDAFLRGFDQESPASPFALTCRALAGRSFSERHWGAEK